MTTITKKDFINQFMSGDGAIDINTLSEETKTTLKNAGLLDDLIRIAGEDGKLQGNIELGRFFNEIDTFEDNELDRKIETTMQYAGMNIPSPSGEVLDALKSEFERKSTNARMNGPQPDNSDSWSKKSQEAYNKKPSSLPDIINHEAIRKTFAGKEASELDKLLPRDPQQLQKWLSDKNMPVDIRAKVLGVVLLRGGSKSLDVHKLPIGDPFWVKQEKVTYQKMAVNAVLKGEPELFKELSAADGGEHLPSHRRPATQLMHIMLQEGGVKGDYKGQNEVQAWIEKLPSDVAGRAMYHMYDAAKSKDYGGSFRITGIGLEVGNKAASVGFSFDGEYNDTHWAEATQNISDGVGDVFGQRSIEEKRLIYEGFRQANTSFGSVILDENSSTHVTSK